MIFRGTFILIAALSTAAVFGDGPPMTPEGEVTVDHLEFRLSPEQIETLGRTRQIEFTPEQLALCRKLNAQFPESLPVIGPAYADCTCGMGAYGMWVRPQRFAIPTTTVTGYNPEIEKELKTGEAFFDERPLILQSQTDAVGAAAGRRLLCMDVRGNLFIYGKPLSAADAANVLSRSSHDKEEKSSYVFINIPPAGDAAIDAKVQESLKSLREAGAKHGVEILITG